MAAPRTQAIPVFLLVKSAFQVFWQQRDDALRLGLVPTLVCFGGFLFGQDALIVLAGHLQQNGMTPPPSGVPLALFGTIVIILLGMALAAGNWLRFMLLGPMGAVGVGLSIGRPHIAFLVSGLVMMFAGSIALSVISMPIMLLPDILAKIGFVVAFILLLLAGVRLSPFLVGQVIAQPMSLRQAWEASRGNGISVATALILVQVPMWIAASLLNQVLFAVGFAKVAPLAMNFMNSAFEIATAILQASVIAVAFRQMVGIRA